MRLSSSRRFRSASTDSGLAAWASGAGIPGREAEAAVVPLSRNPRQHLPLVGPRRPQADISYPWKSCPGQHGKSFSHDAGRSSCPARMPRQLPSHLALVEQRWRENEVPGPYELFDQPYELRQEVCPQTFPVWAHLVIDTGCCAEDDPLKACSKLFITPLCSGARIQFALTLIYPLRR